ncbi:IMV membrane protein A13L, partial [Monkeypox virus]
MIGILLLI